MKLIHDKQFRDGLKDARKAAGSKIAEATEPVLDRELTQKLLLEYSREEINKVYFSGYDAGLGYAETLYELLVHTPTVDDIISYLDGMSRGEADIAAGRLQTALYKYYRRRGDEK